MGFLKEENTVFKDKEQGTIWMEQSRQSVTRMFSFLPQVSLIHFLSMVLWNLPVCLVLSPSKG